MNQHQTQLHYKLYRICQEWMTRGVPTKEILDRTAAELSSWKQRQGITGIWSDSRQMVTATIDDGIGQGIEIISQYAKILGLRVHALGLLQKPEQIIAFCQHSHPAFLGLTILQLDSDEALAHIGHNLPPETALIAGGPVFKYDPDMAQRCGVTYMAANVACFINYLLKWEPGHGTTDG